MMDYQKLIAFRNSYNPFSNRLGIVIQEIGPGFARAVKTVQPEDVNLMGKAHGGLYFTLADSTCGSAMASHGYLAVTTTSSYNFIRGVGVGDTLTAEAHEIKAGRTLCVFSVELTDQHGNLVGTGTFTFYKLNEKIEY